MEFRRVRFRLCPTAGQVRLLERHASNVRFVFNVALEQRLAALKSGRLVPNAFGQAADLKELRADPDLAPWLRETGAQTLQAALRDVDDAFGRWWSGQTGRPRFKSKRAPTRSFRVPQHVAERRESDRMGSIRLPDPAKTLPVGERRVRCRWHRPLPGQVRSAVFVGEADGSWWVSLLCEVPDGSKVSHPHAGSVIGVDLGVRVPVATSEGEQLSFSPLSAGERERLVRLERKLARRPRRKDGDGREVEGANRRKVKRQIGRLHAKARRRRRDFAHQVSNRLTENHGVVVFENLDVVGMTGSARGTVEVPGVGVAAKAGLNRAMREVGWGLIRSLTEQKALARGGVVVRVRPQDSSRTCPECGVVDAASRRSRDLFVCTGCGHAGHADVIAARVIAQRAVGGGLVPTVAEGTPVAACGDFGVGRSAKQEEETAVTGASAPVAA